MSSHTHIFMASSHKVDRITMVSYLLQAKLSATLTPAQKHMYTGVRDCSDEYVALMTRSGILFTSWVVAKTIELANFLRAYNLVTVIRAYTRAFITLGEETLAETSHVAKSSSTAGRFLKVLAISRTASSLRLIRSRKI
ncbi:hypothetical protein AB1N83_006509 [Pleurotus pulmonarius]